MKIKSFLALILLTISILNLNVHQSYGKMTTIERLKINQIKARNRKLKAEKKAKNRKIREKKKRILTEKKARERQIKEKERREKI